MTPDRNEISFLDLAPVSLIAFAYQTTSTVFTTYSSNVTFTTAPTNVTPVPITYPDLFASLPSSNVSFLFSSEFEDPVYLASFTNTSVITPRGTFWDGANTAPNGVVDGGDGVWDAINTNWTFYNGVFNDFWLPQAGAIFAGQPGNVTVVGAQQVSGLDFRTDGYVLRGDALRLDDYGWVNTDPGVTATVENVVTDDGGITTLWKYGAGA